MGLLTGPFVAMVDTNIVNVAVSDIAVELRTSLALIAWVIGAYMLGIAAGLPMSAWLAKNYGVGQVYVGALLAFAVASAGCALAPTASALIALRAVQGLCAAPLVPLSLTLLFTTCSRGQFPAVGGVLMFLAPALGPTVGGTLVAAAGWRSIFLVNVPLVAVGYLGARRIPRPATARLREPFDLRGLILLGAGSILVSLGGSQLTSHGGGLASAWACLAAAIALLVAYGFHASRTRHPVLALRLLSRPGAWAALMVSGLASIVLFAMLFLVPVFVQQVQGRSAWAAGLVLLPQGVVMGVATVAGRRLIGAGRLRRTILGGMAVLGLTTASLLVINTTSSLWLIAILLAGRGLALGATLQPLISGLLGGLGETEAADGSTVFTVSQRIGGSAGIAAIAAFYQARAAVSADPFRDTVWLLIAITAAGAVAAAALPARVAYQSPDRR